MDLMDVSIITQHFTVAHRKINYFGDFLLDESLSFIHATRHFGDLSENNSSKKQQLLLFLVTQLLENSLTFRSNVVEISNVPKNLNLNGYAESNLAVSVLIVMFLCFSFHWCYHII